ncbi:efflux RND transporter permease subunit, partial [Bradyrhizobium sp. NBAIM20]|nr:efflux RND transporter permease subunit [Bradyrhizobium sp. NBAIM20]
MRIAQADLASLRAFADLKRPNGSTTPDYDTDLAVSELAWNAAVANGNTTFTVTRKVTPVINVGASLPGAAPETMASSVALPLEKQFSTIAGLQTISSTNTLGNTSLTLEFDPSRNIDAAAV